MNNKIMILTILLANLIAISSTSWIMLWVFMEISTYLFLSYSSLSIMKTNTKEFFLTYFSMSFIASIFLLTSFVIFHNSFSMQISLMMSNEFLKMDKILITMSFVLKMGMVPFHGWMFSVMENMSWNTMLVLSTIQKIIPIWASFLFLEFNLISMIIFLSSFMMMFIPLKTKSMFYFMASSALMNSMWILISSISGIMVAMFYTMIYFSITTSLIYMFKKFNTVMMNSNWFNISMTINMFSIIGIPPLIGFFSKLNSIMAITLDQLTNNFFLFVILMTFISTTITSFMYLKLLVPNISLIMNNKNMLIMKNKNYMKTILMNLMFPSMIILVETMT